MLTLIRLILAPYLQRSMQRLSKWIFRSTTYEAIPVVVMMCIQQRHSHRHICLLAWMGLLGSPLAEPNGWLPKLPVRVLWSYNQMKNVLAMELVVDLHFHQ
ncbi:hypothetical protein BDA96_08G053000 [Sorghum bicolor]|uniref:Uncharacterized protein n=1 Tax=Sorghum bicolor TaxID=4558 RepID=A0A921U649_SORBI|nr:hypothetical protein BDA96_08G053000 [Sorghum bicolor]